MIGSINGGTPSYHPFLDGIFPEINQPFLGYPHDYGNPHLIGSMNYRFYRCTVSTSQVSCSYPSANVANLNMGALMAEFVTETGVVGTWGILIVDITIEYIIILYVIDYYT